MCVAVHAHRREVAAEARFEEGASTLIEWLSGRTEHRVYDARHLARNGPGRFGGLYQPPFRTLPAGHTSTVDVRRRGGTGDIRIGHAHYLVSDTVGLMLKRIVDRSDSKLRLYGTWRRECGRA